MGEMAMSGSTTSMMWMRMPGQSWPGTAVSFLGMWVAMMAAMMLPSLLPTLWRYREAARHADIGPLNRLTTSVGAGYFVVWAATGAMIFPIGVAAMYATAQQPALARIAPIVAGAAVLLAGALQRTAWKARQLAFCRESPAHSPATRVRTAWRHGMRLGLHCVGSCAGLTAVTLLVGAMDLRVTAVVTAAITAERLAPSDARIVRTIGDAVVVVGLVLLARAAGLGGQGL